MDLNKVMLAGRIAGQPQYFPNTENPDKSRLLITVAVNYQKNDGADFIPVVLWGKTADAGAKWLNKGKEVLIEGRINAKFDKEKDKAYFSINANDVRYGRDSAKVQNEKTAISTEASAETSEQLTQNASIPETKTIDRVALKESLMKTQGLTEAEADATLAKFLPGTPAIKVPAELTVDPNVPF